MLQWEYLFAAWQIINVGMMQQLVIISHIDKR